MNRLCLIIVVLLGVLLLTPTPMRAANPICFEGVTDCVDERFADFWRRNDRHAISGQNGNALRFFGYPIGPARIEAVDGAAMLAQPFERVIMQQPLGNTDPARISLQMIGMERLRQLELAPELPARPPATVNCRFFSETGFTVCGDLLNFWESNGLNLDNERNYTDAERIALFGRPISTVSRERAADGKIYLTQWFEQARLQIDGVTQQIIITPLGRDVVSNRANPPPLPRNNGVFLNSETVTAGGAITARANGYTGESQVRVTVIRADGNSVGTAELSDISSSGVTETFCYQTPADAMPGIWAIAFEGTENGRRTIGFFRVVTTGNSNKTCIDPISPISTNR
ncbi:hypothetical protein [Chloroflexus sp.]|uniref:hypothetical protein n=1 Tax=Chloroflexus sp. TaxID=1904827 RepID=UPI00260D863B|nr:hypothetical protein [uncultured Chloroflexus sp.]